jgi:hypothetical protein
MGTSGYREYRPVGGTAEPKSVVSVVKSLAMIVAAVAVIGAGGVAGVTSLATSPPHPVVLVDSRTSAK